jgi:hypothetical protein
MQDDLSSRSGKEDATPRQNAGAAQFLKNVFILIRPHQYVKNLLIFMPLFFFITDHKTGTAVQCLHRLCRLLALRQLCVYSERLQRSG